MLTVQHHAAASPVQREWIADWALTAEAWTRNPTPQEAFAQPVAWRPAHGPRRRPLRLTLALVVGAVAVWVTGVVVPGVHVKSVTGALHHRRP